MRIDYDRTFGESMGNNESGTWLDHLDTGGGHILVALLVLLGSAVATYFNEMGAVGVAGVALGWLGKSMQKS